MRFPARRLRSQILSLASLLTISCSVACLRQTAPPAPTPAARLQAITAADPAKYPVLNHGNHWGNPYLVIRPQAVALLSATDANEEQILKPEEVPTALAQLPASAWPYGRAVAVLLDEKLAVSDPDKASLRRTRGIVEGELQSAGVAIVWMPQA